MKLEFPEWHVTHPYFPLIGGQTNRHMHTDYAMLMLVARLLGEDLEANNVKNIVCTAVAMQ
jgi:hypothetical protein